MADAPTKSNKPAPCPDCGRIPPIHAVSCPAIRPTEEALKPTVVVEPEPKAAT